MPGSTQIDLIRHGEPQGGKRYRGQVDDPLSETGWRQMWAAVGDHPPWQRIVSSPLSRCAAFARALADRRGLPLTLDERLMEIGFGAWEGRSADELRREDPEQIRRFYQDPVRHRPAGAEVLADFQARVVAGFQALTAAGTEQRILVVTHAGVIRAVLAHLLGAPTSAMYRIDVGYATLTSIRLGPERPPTLIAHAANQVYA